jgi:hypothetical protein
MDVGARGNRLASNPHPKETPMKMLRLTLEDLRVESFTTAAPVEVAAPPTFSRTGLCC